MRQRFGVAVALLGNPKLIIVDEPTAGKLLAGRTIVHVYSDESPGPEFEPVEPDVKDVYFTVMAGHHRRLGVEAA